MVDLLTSVVAAQPVADAVQKLMDFLEDQPTAYLDEITWFVWDEFKILVCEKTIHNILNCHNWNCKACRRRASERSATLREAWLAKQFDMRADQIVFVDESASNEKTGWRKYSWSQRGAPCYTDQPAKRSERWSILPAITVKGYLPSTLIHQGSITANIFLNWLEFTVLPQLRPGQILVMDNASIHRTEGITELVNRFGVYLEYLLLYSPDFNPIKLSFAMLKAFMQRQAEHACEYADFGRFLEWCVDEVSGQSARQQYWSCGYRKGLEDMIV